ncbi:MAG TPA: SDR family oxidoreductase [Roseiflexaceae bacterium]
MRAFVTGSTGLLGNNLVRLLLEQGHQVTALVRSRAKAARLFAGLDVTLVEGDMRDVAAFGAALAGCDVLFHTAAYFREYYQPGDHWARLEAINVHGTVALLAEAERRGVKKVIYTSSNAVIGARPSGEPSDESDPPDARAAQNLYMKSKVLAEQAVLAFLERSSLAVVLILPGWMFGPSDAAPTSSGQLVLDFLNRRLPGIVEGGGDVVDARDVAQAMINAVERGRSGERYIVSGGEFVRLARILELLEQISGVPAPRRRIPFAVTLAYAWLSEIYSRITGRPVLVTVNSVRTLRYRHVTSSAKARRELGASFRPLAETLHDEVAWFRGNQVERLRGVPATSQSPRGV